MFFEREKNPKKNGEWRTRQVMGGSQCNLCRERLWVVVTRWLSLKVDGSDKLRESLVLIKCDLRNINSTSLKTTAYMIYSHTAAMALFGRWNTVVDTVPVGSAGADGRKALNVAAVSLTTRGMELLRMPWWTSSRVDLTPPMMSLLLLCLRCW